MIADGAEIIMITIMHGQIMHSILLAFPKSVSSVFYAPFLCN